MTRQIKLGAFLPGGGQHIAAWRHPDAPADGATNFEFHRRLAETAERGLFDAYFLADNLSVGLGGREGGNAKIAGFEPVTLFAALAPLTTHLGFIATASTTYEEPYTLARKFASLDLLSNGRAGWNVVTSAGDETARNFNRETQPSHADRYERAHEHVETVKALWDSWEDDAFIRDKATGRFFDAGRVHDIDHKGKHFSVKGPLNAPRPVQGHPVVVQAGQSEDGRRLAAVSAEVIFTAHQNLASAQEFYRDIKARVKRAGRNPEHVLIMPGVAPFVGRTEEEARSKYEELNALIVPEDGVALLNGLTGGTLDLTGYPLDGPLPVSNETEGMKSRQALIRKIADEHGFTIRQLYQWIATARGHYTVVGSAEQVADQLEEWFLSEAADGFNILPPWLPGALDDFVDLVIPILQRRGLFRTAYEGRTLRENLGLPRPANPWTLARATVQAAE
ncbi:MULTISPECIES: LLM class flavin-dependent oxidoreductase [Sinorhizobium]|jgi:FMN-dependent oxidoreductase (nitrilotriacetate monooxygenase family)|uniref:Alkanesulfonate monooxygenase n=5 Tax=Sinorhizobium TaxID=28105 RepID=Q92TM7_RHIME|nr:MULTISPECIES: LLM class flavin-dependent oxidoreductase [Sinorhizobium]PST28960.1 FMN-dependent monooxygenase [Mesorhizobium loti]AEG09026.1 FMN-dependent oxidoreductase, nitrilotriacetate monooxygenase family [Sinorhizobium meliloti BL225C]AEH82973.1 putative nitrilotriacetate monooxygenase component A protein [Sinorhizobium meliloti SM11]AGA10265.1 FMN-dependent oxidoreductase, nitrilotriacetate monooxygenase family [Sinorhizobium meliloti GR4]AGG72494.1 Alkanesulfonate monooxygenase [Sin